MPKIAQYEPNQIQTRVTPKPLALPAPQGAFGGQVVKGAASLANAGLQIKQRIDTTSSEAAVIQFERAKNAALFNPESGYFNSQGKDAYDNATAVSKELQKLKRTHGETLNAQSKQMFNRVVDLQLMRTDEDIARHASKGLKAWEIATVESQIENALENASLYWSDGDRLRVQNVLGRQAIIDSSEMMGIGPEATAEKLQTFESSFAYSTITAALQDSASSGEEAFSQYGDRLEGSDKRKIENSIESKRQSEKVQADASMAVLTAGRLVDQYDSRADIIEQVNMIEDSALRKKTMAESMSQLNQKRRAEKEQSNDYYQEAISQVNNGLSPEQMQSQNPDAWLGMTDMQRNNILSGKHMVTDQILFNKLRSMPAREKAKLSAVDYADKLKPSDLQKLTTEIESAKKGKTGSRVKTLSAKSMQAAEGVFGKRAKWTTKRGKVTEKGKLANEFLNDLQEAIDEFEEVKQSRMTPAEENQLIGEFTREILVKKSAFGFDFLAADVELDLSNTPADDIRMMNRIIDSTPAIDVADLTSAYQLLVDNDKPITVENLRTVYEQGRN